MCTLIQIYVILFLNPQSARQRLHSFYFFSDFSVLFFVEHVVCLQATCSVDNVHFLILCVSFLFVSTSNPLAKVVHSFSFFF